jgi:hypothetical protein
LVWFSAIRTNPPPGFSCVVMLLKPDTVDRSVGEYVAMSIWPLPSCAVAASDFIGLR